VAFVTVITFWISAVLDGRGLILRIEPAESVEPARGFGALSKCCEAAVCGQMQSAVAAAVAQGDTDANRDDAIKRWLVRQYQSQSKLHVRGTE
jgi:hypothetical protein